MCLVLSLTVPVAANAATVETVMPLGSDYLDSYNSYVSAVGNGQIEVWFEVWGTGNMADIGALKIELYESSDNTDWTLVKTFSYKDDPTMLSQDNFYHVSHVSYQGTAGKYYKAYVCVWAGIAGGGNTWYMWTSSKLAT